MHASQGRVRQQGLHVASRRRPKEVEALGVQRRAIARLDASQRTISDEII